VPLAQTMELTLKTILVLIIALAGVIGFIISLSTPWYAVTSTTTAPDGTKCPGGVFFYWFTVTTTCPVKCPGCAFTQPLGLPVPALCDPPSKCTASYSVFVTAFALLLLAFFLFLGAIAFYILDKNLFALVGAIVVAVLTFLAIVVFAGALTPAVKSQLPKNYTCDTYTCAKFSGIVPELGPGQPQTFYGPGSGWFFALLCFVVSIVYGVLACCCVSGGGASSGERA